MTDYLAFQAFHNSHSSFGFFWTLISQNWQIDVPLHREAIVILMSRSQIDVDSDSWLSHNGDKASTMKVTKTNDVESKFTYRNVINCLANFDIFHLTRYLITP